VTLESALGRGSIFHVILPLDYHAAARDGAPPELTTSGDDDRTAGPKVEL
jgi:hypothetical protein